VLLDLLVPAGTSRICSQPKIRGQKLSPLIDRINDRYDRCSIGFGLFPADASAFKGHAAFRVLRASISGKIHPCAHWLRTPDR
jgi:hypothetical protein